MISGCFPKIHRLSQNRQNAKSMIPSCFPEIHRLSQNRQPPKSMISSCFPKIHRLSQNRQNTKSMISSHFPEIHRLSAKKGLGTGEICRPKGRLVLWPVVCPMPAGGSAVKGRQRGRWLPVAERAGPLTALQAAGTKPGAKRRAQTRTAADRGTPMPRCQGGCCLANTSLECSANTSLARSVELETGDKGRTCCEEAAGPVGCRGERWMYVSIR